MSKFGGMDVKGLKEFQKKLEGLQDSDAFLRSCAKELAARLLAKVIKRTPVGDYDKYVNFTTKDGRQVSFQPHSGKMGGTLRRGWTGEKNVNAAAYAASMNVQHLGDRYVIEIVNPVEYASYVEFGHRTRSLGGWVSGKFMMTISEDELNQIAPRVLERKLEKYMRGLM